VDERAKPEDVVKVLQKMPGHPAYNYLVGRDGAVYLLVSPDHVAKHATISAPVGGYRPNDSTLGVSFANASFARAGKHPKGWRAGPPPPPGHYNPYPRRPTLWQPYTKAQIDAGVELVAGLLTRFGLGSDAPIIGHQEINPTHPDPGPLFPMRRFRRRVRERIRQGTGAVQLRGVALDPVPDDPWQAVVSVVLLLGVFVAVVKFTQEA